MIFTQQQADQLDKDLQHVFPGCSPRIMTNDSQEINGCKVVIQEIGSPEFAALKLIIEDFDCYINLKRSGTGISILFN
jgi:hypothetical protein